MVNVPTLNARFSFTSTYSVSISTLDSNAFPQDWKGYLIVSSEWRGREGELDRYGPIITIRHPSWTEQAPWLDIPLMVFTRKQWHSVMNEDLVVSAAPTPPGDIGRNAKYVFALPPRYFHAEAK